MRVALVVTGAFWIAMSLFGIVSGVADVARGRFLAAALEGALGLVALVCGAGLAAQRAWARRPVIVLSLAALLQVCFLGWAVLQVLFAPDGPPPHQAGRFAAGLVFGMGLLAGPFGLSATFLLWGRTRKHLLAPNEAAVPATGAGAPHDGSDNNAMNLTNREVPGMKERRPSGEPEHG